MATAQALYGILCVDFNAEISNLDDGSQDQSVKRCAKFELYLLILTIKAEIHKKKKQNKGDSRVNPVQHNICL